MKQKYDYYFLHGKSLNFLQILQKLLVEAIYLFFASFRSRYVYVVLLSTKYGDRRGKKANIVLPPLKIEWSLPNTF
jgi:hypothetical protein